MAKGPDANPGAVRDALTEPDVPFDDQPKAQPNGEAFYSDWPQSGLQRQAEYGEGVSIDDFRAFMEMHAYIFTPSGAMWPASSVNSRMPQIPLVDKNGEPLLDDEGPRQSRRPLTSTSGPRERWEGSTRNFASFKQPPRGRPHGLD